MSITFKLLKQNDPEILELYSRAYELWGKILHEYKGDSATLAKVLDREQIHFEWMIQAKNNKCDRWDGQEIMVFTGLSYYQGETEGDRDMAASVAEAFEMSYCSLEVKGLAKRVAKLFYLGK